MSTPLHYSPVGQYPVGRNPYLAYVGSFLMAATPTQPFGPTTNWFEGKYQWLDPITKAVKFVWQHFHYGVDLGVPSGTALPSFSSGVVVGVIGSGDVGLGNHVEIKSPNGFTYIYGHLSDFMATRYGSGQQTAPLRVGDTVQAGDIIGHTGGGSGDPGHGNSTGPHLHFELRDPNGNPVDPGQNIDSIIWTIVHDLGWGAGYMPQGDPTIRPDPVQHGQAPNVPLPLPPNPAGHDERFYPAYGDYYATAPGTSEPAAPGNPVQPGQPAGVPGTTSGTGDIFSGLPGVGNIGQIIGGTGGPIGAALGAALGGDTSGCAEATVTLGIVIVGLILLVAGLIAITREEPVQTVTQPVREGAGAVVGAGKTAAKVAAL